MSLEENLHKNKNRCFIFNCNGRVVKIIGNCRWCSSNYCQKHRLPEDHSCSGLLDCKKQSFEKNAIQLGKNKCIASKVN
jgi:predicted nucleic acid binding AN1-type Zn finger protein